MLPLPGKEKDSSYQHVSLESRGGEGIGGSRGYLRSIGGNAHLMSWLRIMLSRPPVLRMFPFQAKQGTRLSCPKKVRTNVGVVGSQSPTVPSEDPTAICFASEAQLTLVMYSSFPSHSMRS